MGEQEQREPPALAGEVWRGEIPISTDDGEEVLLAAIVLREADGRPYAHLLHQDRWHTLDEESCGAVFAAAFVTERARAERAEALAAAERAYRVAKGRADALSLIITNGFSRTTVEIKEALAALAAARVKLVEAGGKP